LRGAPFPFLTGVLGIGTKLLCSIISTERALPVNRKAKVFWLGNGSEIDNRPKKLHRRIETRLCQTRLDIPSSRFNFHPTAAGIRPSRFDNR
jgi:hypothetical protein